MINQLLEVTIPLIGHCQTVGACPIDKGNGNTPSCQFLNTVPGGITGTVQFRVSRKDDPATNLLPA